MKAFDLKSLLWIVVLFFFLVGCDKSEEETVHSHGFHLPNGDFQVGQELFVEFKCHRCHTVANVELADHDLPALPKIEIGGKVHRIRSYGELVTSIISPEHVVSPKYLALLSPEEVKKGDVMSPMPAFNEDMTVQQLVDLCTFLFISFEESGIDMRVPLSPAAP